MVEEHPLTKTFTTLYRYDTEYSADSVEWCPHEPHNNIFVCGTYQLQESQTPDQQSKRLGRILLFSIDCNGLKLLQTINTPAILDQKWCHNRIGNSILGIVNAKNTLEIYKLDSETVQLHLLTHYRIGDEDEEILLLSLDWSSGKYESSTPQIVCSDSKGSIHLFRFDNNSLVYENVYKGHSFEAWIAGFYYWDPNIFFSGGDDCLFLKFDKRVGFDAVVKNRSHEAGVTAFHSNCKNEFVVTTGSYDTYIRIWDVRQLKQSQETLQMPGPIWRLKWDPFSYTHLLAACMLGGVHIVDTKRLKIVDSYYEHQNISYGADWSTFTENLSKIESNIMIGSCSFYDHLLCISKVKCDFG